MPPEVYKDWIEHYRIRGLKGGDLKEISGYSHGLAQLTEEGLADITGTARDFLGLKITDRLLDLGCGAGLLTHQLVGDVESMVGLDANSEILVNAGGDSRFARVAAMADHLPFGSSTFDKIFCHSIFQYFPDYQYAVSVVGEMSRVLRLGGRCLIMDIPDTAKKDRYFNTKLPDSHNLERLFYSKEWFDRFAPNSHIFEQRIRDYDNSQFRFNVLIQR